VSPTCELVPVGLEFTPTTASFQMVLRSDKNFTALILFEKKGRQLIIMPKLILIPELILTRIR
jgi:hypothetical protein